MNCLVQLLVDGKEHILHAETGKTISQVLTDGSWKPDLPCGGNGNCGKCKVLAKGSLSEPNAEERKALTEAELGAGWRLACQTVLLGDATISQAALQSNRATILTDGVKGADTIIEPAVRAIQVRLSKASLADQRSMHERLLEALHGTADSVALTGLNDLAKVSAENEAIFAVVDGKTVMHVFTEEPTLLGAAVDIGTTTIAAYLLDLCDGRQLSVRSMLNPQRSYGADVISRTDSSRENLQQLQKCVTEGTTQLIADMLIEIGAAKEDLYRISFVGNTVMLHLLCGISPMGIAKAPFVPVFTAAMRIRSLELNMPFLNAICDIAPCVSGYVGGDTTAAILACNMDRYEGTALLIDIGTNGEIALGGKNGILCCSAAAGPAFEGAHIRCGSGAVDGAISKVELQGGGIVENQKIGNMRALTICGSGLVDAVAEMVRVGIVDETGYMDEEPENKEWMHQMDNTDEGPIFRLTDDGSVFICRKDIREVQLAKSAIASGIKILLKEAGKNTEDIDVLYLAGGFGNYIDIHNACMIGLLPTELEEKVYPVGNAAGSGAKRMLMEYTNIVRMQDFAEKMRYIELSSRKDFSDLFADNMFFE